MMCYEAEEDEGWDDGDEADCYEGAGCVFVSKRTWRCELVK